MVRRLWRAAYNYARYHALALRQVYPERSRRTQDKPPDDLLGLKRLVEVCTALEQAGVEDESCQEATERVFRNSQEELEAKTDDRRIVAELLDVPVEKADSHLSHIASLTHRHVCPVE